MDEELLTRIRKEAYEQGYQDGMVEGYNLAGAKLIKRKKGNMTNADRIRSMTDEELAVWIVHKTEGNGFDGYEESVKAWLDWLREEACDANNSTD